MSAMADSDFRTVAQAISATMGQILATRPYLAILDILGNVYYTHGDLNGHLDFIQQFVTNNFDWLDVGDHSIPFGSKINLGFFRISKRAIVVLYTKKGTSGQLLAFKMRMCEWSSAIESLIDANHDSMLLAYERKEEGKNGNGFPPH